jgi:hypothetical protein
MLACFGKHHKDVMKVVVVYTFYNTAKADRGSFNQLIELPKGGCDIAKKGICIALS